MYIYIERNTSGGFTFSGYIKRRYYDYSLANAKKLYRRECKESGYNGRVYFVEG